MIRHVYVEKMVFFVNLNNKNAETNFGIKWLFLGKKRTKRGKNKRC